jgi:long-subunit acyl-CoA synthetase (AMP-forming)
MQQDLFVERQVKHLFHCNCCSVEFVDNLQFHGIFKTDGAKDARASLSVQDPPAISLRSFAPDAVNVSHIFFTSGSTGRPKGCVCSFGNLLSYCKAKNEIHQAGISWKSKVM